MSADCLNRKAKKLKFNAKNQFKIMQIADLHYENNADIISNNQAITSKLLEAEKPDLVVFSGDQVSGWYSQSPGWYAEMFRLVVAPLMARSIPWASVLGNHDREADLNPQEVTCLDSSYNLSFTGQGILNTDNNVDYILPVYDYIDDEKINAYLIMMDSGRGDCEGDSSTNTGCITTSQTAWLKKTFTSNLYNSTNVLMFVHQPLIQHSIVYHKFPTFGRRNELSSCPEKETGIYNLLSQMGVVHSVNAGHDHNNDFYGRISGAAPALSYGRKTGFGSYGPDYGVSRGARVVQLDTTGVKGWIRTEIGIEGQPGHDPFPIYWSCLADESPVLVLMKCLGLISLFVAVIWLIVWRFKFARRCRKMVLV